MHSDATHIVSRLVLVACTAAPAGTALAQRPAQRAMVMEWEARVERTSKAEELQPLLDSARTSGR